MGILAKNATVAEIARGCFFSEQFRSLAEFYQNEVTVTGGTTLSNGIATTTGSSSGFSYNIPALRTNQSATSVKWSMKVARSAFDGTYKTVFDNSGGLSCLSGGMWCVCDDRGGTNGTNGLRFEIGTTVGGAAAFRTYKSPDNCVPDNTWAEYCLTWNGTAPMTLTINGVAQALTLANGSGSSDYKGKANPLSWGKASDNSAPIAASFKDIKIFNQALTTQESLDYFNNATFQYMNKSVGIYPMQMEQHDYSNLRSLDVSGKGNHLQFGDGSTSTTYPTKLSNAGYSFDGGDYLRTLISPSSFANGATLVALVNQKKTANLVPYIVKWGTAGNRQFSLYRTTTNFISMTVSANGTAFFEDLVTIKVGESVSLCAGVYDNTVSKSYNSNSGFGASVALAGPLNNNNNFISIGADYWNSYFGVCDIHWVGIWDFALTTIQIYDLGSKLKGHQNKV